MRYLQKRSESRDNLRRGRYVQVRRKATSVFRPFIVRRLTPDVSMGGESAASFLCWHQYDEIMEVFYCKLSNHLASSLKL